ncbi:MAG TPA: 2-hydroxyacid dehydrogenase [Candidatus Pacearchaeota archaeon]|nr:2-hydroxyacid dehydrogenase [Candidatus Pacearchaeota archaeon]
MKIVVLEKIDFTDAQKQRLNSLGDVSYYALSSEEECGERVKGADAVIIDWLDPNSFLSEMENPSLLALMSTGYSWIDIKRARSLGISVSNVPDYATEAVAEHIIGLMFAVARKTMVGDKEIKKGNKNKGYLQGIEVAGRKAGIIGLGHIGSRVAQILTCLGAEVSGYDINSKNVAGVKNASLEQLLENSDFVFVTCSLNESSKSLLTTDRLKLMKKDAILLGTTWGVVDLTALIEILENDLIYGAGFDVSIEEDDIVLPKEFTELDNVVLTPHIGYNTKEARKKQADICISNIEQYLKGKTSNIVN